MKMRCEKFLHWFNGSTVIGILHDSPRMLAVKIHSYPVTTCNHKKKQCDTIILGATDDFIGSTRPFSPSRPGSIAYLSTPG